MTEIAPAADLSEMTVYNYFPTKEDLVFGRMEFFKEQLVAAVQQRAPESRRWPPRSDVLADIDQLAAVNEMIAKAAMLIRAAPRYRPGNGKSQRATQPALPAYSPAKSDGRGRHRGVNSRERTDGGPSRINRARSQRSPSRSSRRTARNEAVAQASRAIARLESGLSDYPRPALNSREPARDSARFTVASIMIDFLTKTNTTPGVWTARDGKPQFMARKVRLAAGIAAGARRGWQRASQRRLRH